uniref:Lysyl oxidase homolog n=1 Tax=Neogobius melanostomus TaxID=47308 RepID=A0A8C6U725_9GOBI
MLCVTVPETSKTHSFPVSNLCRVHCIFTTFSVMEKLIVLLVCLLDLMVQMGAGQEQHLRARGPWRHRFQWESNGHVYSLLSTGTQYRSPAQGRKRTQVLLTTKSNRRGSSSLRSRARLEAQNEQMSVLGPDAGQFILASGRPSHRQPAGGHTSSLIQEFSGSGVPRGGRSTAGEEAVVQQATVPPAQPADSTGHPRDAPNSQDLNSVFSNANPPARRTSPPMRQPPGTGYGTRFFHSGLPDLVPDPYFIQSASYIQRMQMYALRCAAEENCLSRSAYSPGVSDLEYRVLLRFPQRVKNQGTADFLPLRPRHQWEWHSCHQHYHSMEAFSNYDLLDVSTGLKVAEGHKASFCLEDTTCDPGVRRRYACTAHTQGLGPGCYDTYHANIDCQWIDITDVPPGNYILKVTVNPSHLVEESDFSNNEVQCDVRYTGSYVQTRNCRITM